MALPTLADMFTTIKEYAELVGNIFVIIGVPSLVLVGRWFYNQRIASLQEQINSLEQQLKESKVLQYDNALAIIQSQKELYQSEIQHREERIGALANEHGKQTQEVERLQDEITQLREDLEALDVAGDVIEDSDQETPQLTGMEAFVAVIKFFAKAYAYKRTLEPEALPEHTNEEEPNSITSSSTPRG